MISIFAITDVYRFRKWWLIKLTDPYQYLISIPLASRITRHLPKTIFKRD